MDTIENNEVETVNPLEAINLPLYALRTALTCASDEQTRYYLNGVFVHAVGDEFRVAATDGHRLFVHSNPKPEGFEVPEWCQKGVIIPREGLKERLALLDKLECSAASIAYAVDAPNLVLSDPQDSCIFKLQPVDGTFADYQAIIDRLRSFEGHDVPDMASTAYDAGYLKDVGAVAKMLEARAVRIFNAPARVGDEGEQIAEPTLITFPENPFAVLILMPMRHDKALGVGAARVLSGAVAGTVGALRAHRTRWADKAEAAKGRAKTEAEAKVKEYDERIAAIIAAAQTVPALPAPSASEDAETSETETEQPAEQPAPSYALADAVGPEPDLASYRRDLNKAAQQRARLVFVGDINRLITESLSCTLSQLADGVPVDDWFDAGLTPEQAAERCRDWRQIGDVLAPDEVGPGEADKPVGLLASPARPQAQFDDPLGTPADLAGLLARHAAIEPQSLNSGAPDSDLPSAPSPQAITISPEAAAAMTEAAKTGRKAGARAKRDFDAFKAQVSAIIERRIGLSLDDLVDVPLRDWFNAHVSAKAAAGRAIKAQKES